MSASMSTSLKSEYMYKYQYILMSMNKSMGAFLMTFSCVQVQVHIL